MLNVLVISSRSTAMNEWLNHLIINTTLKHFKKSGVHSGILICKFEIYSKSSLIIKYSTYIAIAAQWHMGQAWFSYTRLDRHLISQLNAHSRSPSLSHTPLCSFSNPPFLSVSCSPSIISFFSIFHSHALNLSLNPAPFLYFLSFPWPYH